MGKETSEQMTKSSKYADIDLALAEAALDRRRSWREVIGTAAAFIGPLVYFCASFEAGSFRVYMPAFLASSCVTGGLWLFLRRVLVPGAERRRERLLEARRQKEIEKAIEKKDIEKEDTEELRSGRLACEAAC
jgi:hypothetical protein